MSLHSGDNECMIAENAVEVRNVCKSYGLRKNKTKILNSIDLTIKKGAIYGLIGPSGCGKTTLLRVIVRRLLPDFGSVKVFGHSIGSKKSGIPGEGVGYMPQETALYREFTITEILRYFGHIFNMAESDVKQRTDFLLELLQLTNGSAVIKTLSGGQKRRVSFAVSLFQNAPLLILDEPSVGVDPLLRQSIWQHLIKLSEEDNVTVILTSHYIEELKQANVVGLMRNGYLLAEDTPNSLLTKYESTNLEDVFVKLCNQANQTNDRTNSNPDDNFEMIVQENNSKNECCTSNNIQFRPKKKKQIAVKNCKILPGNFLISPNRTKAVVTKNFINLWRSALGFFFQFVTPALQLSIFCLTVGQNPTDLSVGVVNNDVSDLHYGLLFTQSINNDTITLKEYDNIDVAFEAMKKNEIWGLIYMSHNFSSCLLKRFISAGNVADDVLQASKIRIWLDKIDLQIYLPLQMELLEATKKFIHLILEKNNINPSVIDSPVSFETDEIDYKFVESYMVFMTPGVLIVMSHLLCSCLTHLAFILEKSEGLFERVYVAGVTNTEIFIGFITSQGLIMVVQTALSLIVMMLLFNVPCNGSLFLVVVLLIFEGLFGIVQGLLFFILFDDQFFGIFLQVSTFFPFIMFGGIFWPLEGMPVVMRYISYIFPLTIPIAAIRAIMLRGWDLSNLIVLGGVLTPIVWIIISVILIAVVSKFRKQSLF